MKTQITIAGIRVAVDSVTDFTRFFSGYADGNTAHPDISVSVSQSEIDARRALFPETDRFIAETYLIYWKICDELPRFDAFMLHAATLMYNGKAYAFCAKSGTGKSTHAALWQSLLGDKCRFVNGDKPIVRIVNGIPTAFGTPWNGKENRGENISAPLSGVCFLVRDAVPSVRPLDKTNSLFRFLSASHNPRNHSLDDSFYRCVGIAVDNVPMYELRCDISFDAARLSFETLTGDVFR